ncbi:MAG: 5-(carboxyamino)imidazole ribonucleotide mutase, partial [Candidatus Latescibacteria bacterium]|nr:5-(carboxyamino)imidazole ribonucleotide mutase [Candidatus Latescibacterota bacterium]
MRSPNVLACPAGCPTDVVFLTVIYRLLLIFLYNQTTMKVTLILGSESDSDHAKKISDLLSEFDVPSETIVSSAHKVPEKVIEIVSKLNDDPQPQVLITIAGMSNGLGGVVAGSS